MRSSLINGLNLRDMQAVANEYDLSSFYYPTLFPLKFSTTLKWEQLEGDFGAPVMGDVIAWDSRAPRKRREIVSKLTGDIPKIGVAREKTESQMMEYNNLRRLADDAAKQALLDWIWEDQEFCYKGVNARIEFMALQAASSGKLTLNVSNNAGIVTDADVDFAIPTANKSGVAVNITIANAATSKPITTIRSITAAAKAKGKKLAYIYTSQDVVDAILASAETLSVVAPWVMQATNLTQTPTLPSLNNALKGLGLPIIGVVESFVNVEIAGVRTQINPWKTGSMLFSETATLGTTAHTTLADETVESTTSLKVKRGHVLIKRFANEEPLVETCLAMANAFPVLANAQSKYLVNTQGNTWS